MPGNLFCFAGSVLKRTGHSVRTQQTCVDSRGDRAASPGQPASEQWQNLHEDAASDCMLGFSRDYSGHKTNQQVLLPYQPKYVAVTATYVNAVRLLTVAARVCRIR